MTNLIPLRHNNQILARDLHFFIDAKRQFANWINERIENYDLRLRYRTCLYQRSPTQRILYNLRYG